MALFGCVVIVMLVFVFFAIVEGGRGSVPEKPGRGDWSRLSLREPMDGRADNNGHRRAATSRPFHGPLVATASKAPTGNSTRVERDGPVLQLLEQEPPVKNGDRTCAADDPGDGRDRRGKIDSGETDITVACRPVIAVQDRTANCSSPPVAITLRGLTKRYEDVAGPVYAIRNMTQVIHEEVTGIIGPSGSGKTTLLNLLAGIDMPTAGQVIVFGESLAFDDPAAMRRHRAETFNLVFQELNLIGHQNAQENVALGLFCRGVPRAEAMQKALESMGLLGITHLARRYPHQLSRGQAQRVAIARAFASRARIILADEPTGSLDPETAEAVMAQLSEVSKRSGRTVVVVTHNHALAHRFCDRVLECGPQGLRDVSGQPESAREEPAAMSEPSVSLVEERLAGQYVLGVEKGMPESSGNGFLWKGASI